MSNTAVQRLAPATEAIRFLTRFNYNLVTVQLLRDGKPYKCFVFDSEKIESVIPKLQKIQAKTKAEIFFMVNQGDGITHTGQKYPRSQKSVQELTALFIDTDDCPISKVKAYLKSVNLQPHTVVESSPGKYHLYFLIDSIPAHENWGGIKRWQAVQSCFSKLGEAERQDPYCDPNMRDHSRVLRVPGFYHLKDKAKPFRTRIVYESDHALYNLNEVYDQVSGQDFLESGTKGNLYQVPESEIRVGRHLDMTAFLAHLLNNGIHPSVAEDLFYSHAKAHYKDAALFLDGGSRHKEVKEFIDWKLGDLQQESEKEQQAKAITLLDSTTDKLPDEFFYNAPGLVGEMVREICEHSVQPYPSFAFAASVSAVGTLKAKFVRSEYRNTAPCLFFFCLEHSGKGKDFPRKAILQAFERLKLLGLASQKFRSAQGFHKRLQRTKGIQCVLHDEAHHFFEMLATSGNDYARAIRPMLLELYSGPDNPSFDPGEVVTGKNELMPIPYPCVNYCGFGVPIGLETVFNARSLNDGFLNRFLILVENKALITVEEDEQAMPAKFKFEHKLKGLLTKYGFTLEEQLQESDPHQTTKRKFIKVPFEDEAKTRYREFFREMNEFRNESELPIATLYSRAHENVGRLAIALADDVITLEIVEWCIKFVTHTLSKLKEHTGKLEQGAIAKDLDDMERFIAKHMNGSGKPVPYRTIARGFRVRDTAYLKKLLNDAVETDTLEIVRNYRKGKTGKFGTAYKLASLL